MTSQGRSFFGGKVLGSWNLPSIPFVSISSSSSSPLAQVQSFFSRRHRKKREIFLRSRSPSQSSFCVCLKSRPRRRDIMGLWRDVFWFCFLPTTHYSHVVACKFQNCIRTPQKKRFWYTTTVASNLKDALQSTQFRLHFIFLLIKYYMVNNGGSRRQHFLLYIF